MDIACSPFSTPLPLKQLHNLPHNSELIWGTWLLCFGQSTTLQTRQQLRDSNRSNVLSLAVAVGYYWGARRVEEMWILLSSTTSRHNSFNILLFLRGRFTPVKTNKRSQIWHCTGSALVESTGQVDTSGYSQVVREPSITQVFHHSEWLQSCLSQRQVHLSQDITVMALH